MKARFNFGKLAGKDDLYGRDSELKMLIQIISGGGSAALSSIRGMGKSSLIKAASENFYDRKFMWVSFESVYSSLDLAQHLFNGLLSANVISENSSELIKLDDARRNIVTSGFSASRFVETLFNEYVFTAERLILVLDEITHARRLGRLYNQLLNIIYYATKRDRIQTIMASSEIGIIHDTIKSEQLPFYNMLNLIELRPLDKPTSLNYLYEGLEFYGASCPKARIYEYYMISEGIPVWLSLSGLRMVEGLCSPDGIYRDNRALKYVLEQLVQLSKKEKEILRLISKRKNISVAGTHLKRNINSLIGKGLLIKTQSGYIVPDPVMEHMLAHDIL